MVILDTILLTHETLDWAKHSGQPLIFLKSDFSRTDDMIDWMFMFRAMAEMGFPDPFIDTTSLLFDAASACVKVNCVYSISFSIFPQDAKVCHTKERGAPGLPLAIYPFFIVAEVVNSMIKAGGLRGGYQGHHPSNWGSPTDISPTR